MVPHILKNFNVFLNAESFLGVMEQITLPELVMKLETLRFGGTIGDLDIATGIEKLEVGLTSYEVNTAILSTFGNPDISGDQLTFRGFEEADGVGSRPVEITMRGRTTSIPLRSAKAGDTPTSEIKFMATYLEYKLNGDVILEIDLIGQRLFVDGVDRLASQRSALGV